jgi:hypothetical protein
VFVDICYVAEKVCCENEDLFHCFIQLMHQARFWLICFLCSLQFSANYLQGFFMVWCCGSVYHHIFHKTEKMNKIMEVEIRIIITCCFLFCQKITLLLVQPTLLFSIKIIITINTFHYHLHLDMDVSLTSPESLYLVEICWTWIIKFKCHITSKCSTKLYSHWA